MKIESTLKINNRIVDRAILQQDKIEGARYACRKWLKNLMIDILRDKIEAVIIIDNQELTTLKLEPKRQSEKLIFTKAAELSRYYAWVTLTQGFGNTYGVSYGLNDVFQKPKENKPVKPVEIQQQLF